MVLWIVVLFHLIKPLCQNLKSQHCLTARGFFCLFVLFFYTCLQCLTRLVGSINNPPALYAYELDQAGTKAELTDASSQHCTCVLTNVASPASSLTLLTHTHMQVNSPMGSPIRISSLHQML